MGSQLQLLLARGENHQPSTSFYASPLDIEAKPPPVLVPCPVRHDPVVYHITAMFSFLV